MREAASELRPPLRRAAGNTATIEGKILIGGYSNAEVILI